ncbi:zinc finger protein 271-like [Pelobates fuscus]|uniref:zinc finger protein 271-like n=1 Tax=Pelobates fuscus TaxID=191477 RepID=UPI002FE4E460
MDSCTTSNTIRNEYHTESFPVDWEGETDISLSIRNEDNNYGNFQEAVENKGIHVAETEKSVPDKVENGQYFLDFWERSVQMDSRIHNGEKRYHCNECGKTFTRKSSLIVHQRIHTGEKQFMCTECGKRFGLKSSLVRHLRTHTPKTLNICPDCGKCFTRYSSLFQHQKVHRREKTYKCTDCNKSFLREPQFVAHQKTHKTLKPCEKEECNENVDDQDRCDNHSNTSSTVMPFVCEECGMNFKEQSAFKRHQRTHTGKDSVLKDNSDEEHNGSFDGMDNISKLRNVKKNCVKPLKKKGCCRKNMEQTVKSAGKTIQTERRTPCSEKRYLCIDCGKSFTRKSSLIVHQRIHTGEKRFMCTECGKRFGLKSSLVRHLRTHTPKTLNICPDCGKCFTRYSSLFQHQKVHKREKPYKCSQCEKCFPRLSQLVVHQRTHKGEQEPNQTENVNDLNKISKRSRTKRTEKSPMCAQCGKSFRERSLLIRHLKTHTVSDQNAEANPDLIRTDSTICEQVSIHKVSLKSNQDKKDKGALEATSPEITENGECAVSIWDGSDISDRRTCSGEKRYFCIDCGKSFTRKSSLMVHQRIHTGEKHFMCTECGKRFGLKSSLVRHLRTHTPKTLNICPDCGKCFTRYSSLFQHQKVHRREKPFKCSKCDKSFARASQLVFHQRTHKEEKQSEKRECEEKVDVHSSTNSPEHSYVCMECGKSFFEENLLLAHQKIHRADCKSLPICEGGEPDDRPDLLDRETEYVAKSFLVEEDHYMNPQIPESVNTNADLVSGELNKDRELPVDSKVKSCRRSRSADKRYNCSDCGKSFTRRSSLIVHQRIHTGEKRFVCAECGKRFGLKSSLVRHMRTHTGHALNICSECGIYFSRYSDLLLHLEIHVGQPQIKSDGTISEMDSEKSPNLPDLDLSVDKVLGCVPLLKHPDSCLLTKDQGSDSEGFLQKNQQQLKMPVASENVHNYLDTECTESDQQTEEDVLDQESLNIKQESPENTSTGSEGHQDGDKIEDFPSYPYSLDWGVEFDISKSFNGDENSTKLPKHRKSKENHTENPSTDGTENNDFGISVWNSSDFVDKRSHSEEKRYLCIDCGKSFTRKSSLIVHQRIHTGEKLFMCTECGKRFGLKSSLVRHQRIHSTEFFTCTECGKSFREYTKFLQHQASHTGEWPYTEPHLTVH